MLAVVKCEDSLVKTLLDTSMPESETSFGGGEVRPEEPGGL